MTEFDRSRRPLVVDGVLAQSMSSLVGGAFFAAFTLELGASGFQIRLAAALPAVGQLCQLPAVILVRRVGRRKPVALGAAVLSRLTWLGIAAVPFFLAPSPAIGAVAVLLLVSSGFGSTEIVAWRSWMRDLIPLEVMGRFFARRMQFANLAAVGLSLTGGTSWISGRRARRRRAAPIRSSSPPASSWVSRAWNCSLA